MPAHQAAGEARYYLERRAGERWNRPWPATRRLTTVNWRDDAACARADPDLFFPVSASGLALRQIDEAKRVCQGCPARKPCLEWALDHGVAAGIWGGATDEERRAMRQRLMHRQR
jgi:WhiB family transcriptional regulator, redox-sensing transcriptional regulator